ncbi:MAG TPA: hypothetical protein PKG80_02620 [Acidobacteriota bacterium]|nr:hypothetical protein [Acidobacteriota bacterium]
MGPFLVPIVMFVCLFTFLSIAVWSGARRKEREAFYRAEERKRLLEASGVGADKVLELLREEELVSQRKRREGVKLGGVIVLAAGIGMQMMFIQINDPEAQFVPAIPICIGAAMLLYAYLMAPKVPAAKRED